VVEYMTVQHARGVTTHHGLFTHPQLNSSHGTQFLLQHLIPHVFIEDIAHMPSEYIEEIKTQCGR